MCYLKKLNSQIDDYIEENKNGLFFSEQTTDSLSKALIEFNSISFDHRKIQESAQKFGLKYFNDSILDFVESSRNH